MCDPFILQSQVKYQEYILFQVENRTVT